MKSILSNRKFGKNTGKYYGIELEFWRLLEISS